MDWLLIAILCSLLAELFLHLPLLAAAEDASRIAGKAGRVISAKGISDHWKEKVMLVYAGGLMKQTLRLALWFALWGAALVGLVWLFDTIDPGFYAFLTSWQGLLVSLIWSTVFVIARNRLVGGRGAKAAEAGYSPTDRILHRLALGLRPAAEMSFDMEMKSTAGDPVAAREGRHVFVSGLARAGTTVLMRRFHASGRFRSLTYRDMPFVLAPGRWKRMTAKSSRDIARSERAHGDRLEVDADSPESLDEVFWRTFAREDYLRDDRLVPHRADDETLEKLRGYVAAILASEDPPAERYLSKNNNNILRLPTIRRAFPNALILIPFRRPQDHAASLLAQHRHFMKSQGEDPFELSYMTWLAHHEFGRGHRPFAFDGTKPEGDPERFDYWLRLWRDAYAFLEADAPADAIFVRYEALCADPEVWESLARIGDIQPREGSQPYETFEASLREPPADADPALLTEATEIYDRLAARSDAALARA